MNLYTEKLLNSLARYESKCGLDPNDSILDALWYDYSCANPVDDGQVRRAEDRISPVFAELSTASSDLLSDLIVALLTSYQRAAYLEGLRMGVNLMLELSPGCP